MISLRNLSLSSAAALLLAPATAALAGQPAAVLLVCPGGVSAPVCAALKQAFEAQYPGTGVTLSGTAGSQAGLTVQYQEVHRAADWLSGRLAWTARDGSSGQGPVIEHSVMDRQLQPQDLAGYAGVLVRSSQIPL